MEEQIKLYENKAFIKVDGPVIAGWHECQFKELLACQEEEYKDQLKDQLIKWVGKPIPKEIMADVLALVKHYPRMEVQVCLYYNYKEEKWLAHVPKQKGTAAHVSYNDEAYEPPKGFYFTGTIHTHPNMGAFWSGTDTNDQTKKTGLHVVLGLRDGDLNEYLVSVFYNGVRYDQDKAVVEIPDLKELPEAKQDWLDAVEEVYEPETKKDEKFKYELSGAFEDSQWVKTRSEFLRNYHSLPNYKYKYDDYGWEYDDDGMPYTKRSTSSISNLGKNRLLGDLFDLIISHFTEDDIYAAASEMMDAIGENAIAGQIEEARSITKESNSLCSMYS